MPIRQSACYYVCMTNIEGLKQTLALRVRICLAANRTTQIELAKVLGVSRPALSQKIGGSIAFSAYEVAELSKFFHVSTDSLLGLKPLEVE